MHSNLDKIAKTAHPKGAEFLNAAHACRADHPLNNSFAFRNLNFMIQSRSVSYDLRYWISLKAKEEGA